MAKKRFYKDSNASGARTYAKKTMNRDGDMIREDFSAPSLLPRDVKDVYWPKSQLYMNGGIQDLFMGVHDQLREDGEDLKRVFGPKKY
jgi:hypothetical protein